MTAAAVLDRPDAPDAPVKPCYWCTRRRRTRGGDLRLPLKYPFTMGTQHLLNTFEIHPWLEDHPLGGLARALRDAVVSNA